MPLALQAADMRAIQSWRYCCFFSFRPTKECCIAFSTDCFADRYRLWLPPLKPRACFNVLRLLFLDAGALVDLGIFKLLRLNYQSDNWVFTLRRSDWESMGSLRNWRFRFDDLPDRRWRRPAVLRLYLPLPVFLKRLATDFLVFCLGIMIPFNSFSKFVDPTFFHHDRKGDSYSSLFARETLHLLEFSLFVQSL